MTYQWVDTRHSAIQASDGRLIPVDPDNRDYAELIASGASIAEMTIDLVTYATAKQEAVMFGGCVINGVPVSTTVNGKVDMSGAVSLAQLVPDHVFQWVTNAGAISLTAVQIIAVGEAVGLWVQSTYSVLGQVLAGIAAGTITTMAQIDAAGWPSNT